MRQDPAWTHDKGCRSWGRWIQGNNSPAIGVCTDMRLWCAWLGLASCAIAWGQGVWAVRDARVFDGSRFRDGWTVVVEGGKITAAGPQAKAPDGAQILDGRGRTLLPGLIDAHVHAVSADALRAGLAFGVTTELDMFSLPGMAAGGGADAADLRTSGILATAPGGQGSEYGVPIPTLRGPEDAEAFVEARVKDGADYIKLVLDDGRAFGGSRPTLSAETVRALVAAAHTRASSQSRISLPKTMCA